MSSRTRRAVLSLGSNEGDRLANLQGAVDSLADTPRIDVVAVSPVYATDPVGGPEQGEYLNAVVVLDTMLSARTLLERAHAVEAAHGRLRAERWGPRTLDIDLLALGDLQRADDTVTVPHPRAHERAFVLVPWHDVDPDAVVAGRGEVAELLAAVDCSGVRPRPDQQLVVPT